MTKSSLAAGRSTPVRVANRARRESSRASTTDSSTAASATVSVIDSTLGSVIVGPDVHGRRELQALVAGDLSGDARDVDLGLAEGLERVLVDGGAVPLGDAVD